jgi:hypothetical protein
VFAIALVPIVLGVVVGWGGFLGFRERLTRESGTGVRTAASLRSEAAFKLANRIAGLPPGARWPWSPGSRRSPCRPRPG